MGSDVFPLNLYLMMQNHCYYQKWFFSSKLILLRTLCISAVFNKKKNFHVSNFVMTSRLKNHCSNPPGGLILLKFSQIVAKR